MVFLCGICFEGKSVTAYNAAFVAIIDHMQEAHVRAPSCVRVPPQLMPCAYKALSFDLDAMT